MSVTVRAVGRRESWTRVVLLGALSACRPASSDAAPPAPAVTASSSSPSSLPSPSPSSSPPGHAATIEVDLAGDVIPQQKVLANTIADVFANAPTCWRDADARVFNLEAPIGARESLTSDKSTLAYAAPPAWFADLYAASRASAFVVANNHACDLGPQGLADTAREAAKLSAPIVGVEANDPWKRVDFIERNGRHVCLVAWTTFLNDKGKKQRGCIDGEAGAKVARAELTSQGLDTIQRELGREGRWDGCDARIAYVHGGREYQTQIRPVLDQAAAAASYVDAVIVSHPHIPDGVEIVKAAAPRDAHADLAGRARDRGVPVFKSLGNFISNQGLGWTSGMSTELIQTDGVPDPLRIVWTRVAMIARLRFTWDDAAPLAHAPSTVRYGYTLAFIDREPIASIRLRAFPSTDAHTDATAEHLATAPKPFGPLLRDRCHVPSEAPPPCDPDAH
ncbi:MAG: CapA family protein [Polyangiales bacterium]